MPNFRLANIEQYQHGNGLFPATADTRNPDMTAYWLRDNYWISLGLPEHSRSKVIVAFQKIVDNHRKKLEYHAEVKPTEEWMFFHPRYNFDLQEFREKWGWIQLDAASNVLELVSEERDYERSRLLLDYLRCIEAWRCPDYGIWEEGPRQLRSSTLGSIIRGVSAYKRIFNEDGYVDALIESAQDNLHRLLPRETETREVDLALLFLLYPKQVVDDRARDEILDRAKTELEGTFGAKRYKGDKWDGLYHSLGEGNEMEWSMYWPLVYLITGDESYFRKAVELRKGFGTLPEGFVEGKPNVNRTFLMAESLYNQAVSRHTSRASIRNGVLV
ncbi:MAG: hypothetical protein HYT70_01235 [Candidatus Aenigmarchaeota archaeon]|nr:hypothetical protein [Candidatus Aenigmarchaeota archaeon]